MSGKFIGESESLQPVLVDSATNPSRKRRHSGHVSVNSTPKDVPVNDSKVRKVSRAINVGAPCSSSTTITNNSSVIASSVQPSSSGNHKKELKFLTDFYPERTETGPLTRSKTRNVDNKSTGAKSDSRSSKKARKNKPISIPPTPIEFSLDSQQAHSPTPDPSSSNLTVAGSEASGFSFAGFSSENSQTIDSTALRAIGLEGSNQSATNFGLLNTMPTTSRNDGVNASSGNTNQPFLSRSQHVQRASHFLGSLVPRMQHLLGGTVGSSSNSAASFTPNSDYLPHMRVLNLIEELRSDNEIRQSEACSELSDMLLLGNEESLPNFPIRELILCLIALLNKDHNFELMLSASRCITNLQEALPRSATLLVEAIPILLQKLKRIEYIDLAEQALVILEVISRRNAKNIFASSGIQSVISHVDFFSMPSQRLAFQIAANCASYVTNSEFHMVQDSLADLTQRLDMDDKRCVESICTFFNRLIENMRFYPNRLRQIAGKNNALMVFQQLLTIQPPTINSNTFINLIKSLRYICTSCGDLSVALFVMDFSKTLRYLLIGSEKKIGQSPSIEATRPAQQLREIVDLIGELLPKLPNTGIFEINSYMEQFTNPISSIQQSGRHKSFGSANWFYRSSNEPVLDNDALGWKSFSSTDQMTLERNHSMGVHSMALELEGQLCEINFASMNRRIVATGVVLPIDRRSVTVNAEGIDERNSLLEKNLEPFLEFVGAIFPLLVEIGSSSTCSNLRYDCVRVMIRMVYAVHTNEQLLSFLKDVPLAAYISSTLSSSKNTALVALAVQLVRVLLEKLPHLYVPLFESEGVFYELNLKAAALPPKKTPTKLSSLKSSSSSRLHAAPSSTSSTLDRHKSHSQLETNRISNTLDTSASTTLRLLQQQMFQSSQSSHSDSQLLPPSTTNSNSTTPTGPTTLRYAPPPQAFGLDSLNRGVLPNLFLSANSLQGPASSLYQTLSNAVNQGYSQYNLNINSLTSQIDAVASSISGSHSSVLNNSVSLLKSTAAEKLEAFIYTESLNLTSTYCNELANSNTGMNSLIGIAESLSDDSMDVGLKPLQDLRDVLLSCELSAFQINYSGIISSLIFYLTENSDKLQPPRLDRLQRFASVFMLLSDNVRPLGDDTAFPAFSCLINKVILAVERLEQFNVRITNLANLSSLSGSSSSHNSSNSSTYLRGAQALRFFQSNQIRCNLRRHPSCKLLRDWRRGRGSIKVDPFTSISAIERYLIDRGIGTSQEESSENEEISDEEKEGSSNSNFKGRIEILIGDTPLPNDISILQAIQQYSLSGDEDQETISQNIFVSGHTLYYRGITSEDESGPSTSGQSSSKNTGTSTESRTLSPLRKAKSSRLKKCKSTEKRSKDGKKVLAIGDSKKVVKTQGLERYLTTSLEHPLDGDPSERGLVLLRILYGLNTFWYSLYENEHALPSTHLPILTQNVFHSSKLNSKVSRQLSDFLTVATQQIPRWTKSLVRSVPLIFPFITRRNFLYCTGFGRDRALMHLVNETNPDDHDNESNSRLVPRLERRKITINRLTLLKDSQHAMTQLGSSKPLLEVSFDGEVGTGFGPTLEFYSTLSREIQKHSNRLWQGNPTVHLEDGESIEYTDAESGLYPSISRQPSASRSWDSRTKRFEFIGRLLAQCCLDSRILDIPLASPFFRWILGEQDNMGLADLEKLEPTIYNSLRQIGKLTEDDFTSFDMNFTYPGNESFELIKGGKNKILTHENYRQFVDLICKWRLVDGVRSDMESVQRGFQQVINTDHLSIFEASEMEGLFCGCVESADDSVWSRQILQQTIRPDHGYTHDSPQITWLIDMLMSFNHEERRKFLQFVTGSPRLPVGGFRALHPPLTVVRKTAAYGSELPSVATCYNYLKLPNYEDYDIFYDRFQVALQHIYSFHMS